MIVIPKKAQQDIMELAVEDWTPFFDVTSTIRGTMPGRSDDEIIDEARQFVLQMLSRGYIELYYDCWTKSSGRHRHVEVLTSAQRDAEIHDRANWLYHERREPDQRWVTVAATPEGEKALLAGAYF